MVIQSKNLVIREIEGNDASAMLEAMECPQVSEMYGNGLTDLEKVLSYIKVIENEYQNGKYRTFAIAEPQTNKMIGSITIDATPFFSRAEYSYWINRNYRNHGYATETVNAMNRYCFETLSVNRIQVMTSNPISEKVVMKSGMSYEGTLRQYFGLEGRFWDVKVFSILAEEYNK